MESLQNNTWTRRYVCSGLVSYKWIFKQKNGNPGIDQGRFKARLVATSFT